MRLNIAVAPVLLREKVMDFLQARTAQWAEWGRQDQDCTVGGVEQTGPGLFSGQSGEVELHSGRSVGEAIA